MNATPNPDEGRKLADAKAGKIVQFTPDNWRRFLPPENRAEYWTKVVAIEELTEGTELFDASASYCYGRVLLVDTRNADDADAQVVLPLVEWRKSQWDTDRDYIRPRDLENLWRLATDADRDAYWAAQGDDD